MNLLFWYRSLMRSVGAALVKLIATATSGLVSFTTNVIRPVKVTCEFSPVQEGTGDPSPDNVRPISGWTGCNITDVVNLLAGVTFERGTIAAATGQEQASTNRLRSDYIWLVAGTYTVTSKSGYKNVVDVYDSEKAFKKNESYTSWSETSSREFTLSSDRYIRILFSKPDNANITLNELTDNEMLIGSQSTTLSITFTDPTTGDSLTVYGGTVTLNEDGSADLVKSHAIADLGDYTIAAYSGGFLINGIPHLKAQSGVGKNLYDLGYRCDSLAIGSVQNASYFKPARDENTVFQRNSYASIWFWHNGLSDTTDAKDFLSGKTIAYELRDDAKQTYHFDNIGQLNSFLGTNNIWHDMNGGITAEYWNKQ